MKFHHLALILLSTPAFGQSLNNLNLDYWYDPNAELELIINPINTGKQVRVYYQITSTRKENTIGSYSIAWENRQSLTEKSGEAISATDSVIDKTINSISGMLTFPGSTKRWYLTAKVTNNSTQGFFYFYKPIDPLWPVNNVVTVNRNALMKRYVALGSEVSGSKPIGKNVQGFMYKKIFDAAQPSFAELGRTDPFLKADSVFVLPNTFIPKSIGLYLFQEDTTSAMGISFLATERSYPKFTSLASLAGPLIYITTDEEYQRLGAALTDKAAFDKVILEITRDKERAKNLMRSYFQRVEAANR